MMKINNEISNTVYSLLSWIEIEDLCLALTAAGEEEDFTIVKYAEKLGLSPAVLREWGKSREKRAAV